MNAMISGSSVLASPKACTFGVIVEITEILQQIERELLAGQGAFAQLADERLPVAFLPYEVGGFAQPLREWGEDWFA